MPAAGHEQAVLGPRVTVGETRNESLSTGSGHSTRFVRHLHISDKPRNRMARHEQAKRVEWLPGPNGNLNFREANRPARVETAV
jgi:hypothetical protein